MNWVLEHYDLWRALHIISVIAWMAGLMYLPRLYAYHTRHRENREIAQVFEGMETKLIKIIMHPAFGLSLIFGATLIYVDSRRLDFQNFPHVAATLKLLAVLFIAFWHVFLVRSQKSVADGTNKHSEKFWRATNELPFLAAIVMVLAVTTE
ncbi:MAG: CopD family protein, partial [Caulobacteraceae bacterium]